MQPAILWPDVEADAVTYLKAALAARQALPYATGVHVGTGLPGKRPRRAVVVRYDGGQWLGDLRHTANLAVQVWAETDEAAFDLAALVAALLGCWPDGAPVLTAKPSMPWRVQDPAGTPMRFLTCSLTVRGTTI